MKTKEKMKIRKSISSNIKNLIVDYWKEKYGLDCSNSLYFQINWKNSYFKSKFTNEKEVAILFDGGYFVDYDLTEEKLNNNTLFIEIYYTISFESMNKYNNNMEVKDYFYYQYNHKQFNRDLILNELGI